MPRPRSPRPLASPLKRPVVLLALAWAGAGAWLAGCACSRLGGSRPSEQTGPDASTVDAASDAGGDASSCTPAVCTPCECGPSDDGCGQILDCGPCPELRSCTDHYGSADDFELCEETEQHCAFNVTKNGRSCATICAEHRGECIASYGNSHGCETVYDNVDLGCRAADHGDDVCVCSRWPDCYVALPLDAGVEDVPSPTGSTLLYRVNFENGTTNANPGSSSVETMSGGSVTVVANPAKDGRNGSDHVGRHTVPTGYTRAELSSQRLTTANRTYIYKWSYYVPSSFFDADINWNLISQWKTWPCGDHNGDGAAICGNCGIFNDLIARANQFEFEYRAEPDCYQGSPPMITDQWVEFVSEVRWANSNTGYVRLWQNGQLSYEQHDIKTLFDGFDPGSCDMYWAVGVYSNNTGGLTVYSDNIQIWE